jgi:hypothetical protein
MLAVVTLAPVFLPKLYSGHAVTLRKLGSNAARYRESNCDGVSVRLRDEELNEHKVICGELTVAGCDKATSTLPATFLVLVGPAALRIWDILHQCDGLVSADIVFDCKYSTLTRNVLPLWALLPCARAQKKGLQGCGSGSLSPVN